MVLAERLFKNFLSPYLLLNRPVVGNNDGLFFYASTYSAAFVVSRFTLRLRLCFLACVKSYAVCMFNHTSAEVLNAIPSLKAISGLTLMCPLSSSERFLRLTPKASAASVTLKPNGAKHNSLSTSTGCAGFFITNRSLICPPFNDNRDNRLGRRRHSRIEK